jgi:ankyrin repeat protein
LGKITKPTTRTRSNLIFRSVLQIAIFEGDLDVFRLLLSRVVDINLRGSYCDSALSAMANRGYDIILKELLGYSIDPSLGESHTLVKVARRGNDNVVSILLDTRANLHS